MSDTSETVLEAVYAALHANNAGLDPLIGRLKMALAAEGRRDIQVQKERLPQNNRQGRKMLQTYFRKRGVEVVFDAA